MKFNRFLIVLMIFFAAISSCSLFGPSNEEVSLWEQAKRGTSEDCDAYLVKYPKGQYVEEIQRLRDEKLEKEFYDRAVAGSIADYEEYLKNYPSGKYVNEVESLFYKFAKEGSAQDCERYLSALPEGANKEEIAALSAKKLAEENAYKKALDGSTLDCADYIKTYPEGRFYKEIYERFYKLVKKGTSKDCELFEQTLPQDEKLQEIQILKAEKIEFETYETAKTGTDVDCENYLKKYAQGKYISEVREILFNLIRTVKKVRIETPDGKERIEERTEYNPNAEALFLKYFPDDYRSHVISQNKDKHLTREVRIIVPEWFKNPPEVIGETLCGLGSISYDSPEQLNLIKSKAEEIAKKHIMKKSFNLIINTFTHFLKNRCSMTERELKTLNIEKKLMNAVLEGVEIAKSESIEQVNHSILYCLAQISFENVFDIISLFADLIFIEADEISEDFPDFIDTEVALVQMKEIMKNLQKEEFNRVEIFEPYGKYIENIDLSKNIAQVRAFGADKNMDSALMQAYLIVAAKLVRIDTIDMEDISQDADWLKIVYKSCRTVPAKSEYRLRDKIWEWEGIVLCDRAKILDWAKSKNYLIGPVPEKLAKFNISVIPQNLLNKTENIYFANNYERIASQRIEKILKDYKINLKDYEEALQELPDNIEPTIGMNVDLFLTYELEVYEPDYTSIEIKLTLNLISAGNSRVINTLHRTYSFRSSDIIRATVHINNFVEQVATEFLKNIEYYWERENRKGFLYRLVFSNIDDDKKQKINETLDVLISPYYKKIKIYLDSQDVYNISFYAMLKYNDSTMFYEILLSELAKNGLNIQTKILTSKHAIFIALE